MAAPIGHIYLALKLLVGPLVGVNEQAFILGASFPDIRYAAHVPREYTHKAAVKWCDVVGEVDPFVAGMLFHSLVDEMREKHFLTHAPVYFQLQRFGSIGSYLVKAAEDIVLFSCLRDSEFVRHFDVILAQEKLFIFDESVIRAWHDSLKNYFVCGPTAQSLAQLIGRDYRFGANVFYRLANRIAQTERFRKWVISFYDNFETILANSFSFACMRA